MDRVSYDMNFPRGPMLHSKLGNSDHSRRGLHDQALSYHSVLRAYGHCCPSSLCSEMLPSGPPSKRPSLPPSRQTTFRDHEKFKAIIQLSGGITRSCTPTAIDPVSQLFLTTFCEFYAVSGSVVCRLEGHLEGRSKGSISGKNNTKDTGRMPDARCTLLHHVVHDSSKRLRAIPFRRHRQQSGRPRLAVASLSI